MVCKDQDGLALLQHRLFSSPSPSIPSPVKSGESTAEVYLPAERRRDGLVRSLHPSSGRILGLQPPSQELLRWLLKSTTSALAWVW